MLTKLEGLLAALAAIEGMDPKDKEMLFGLCGKTYTEHTRLRAERSQIIRELACENAMKLDLLDLFGAEANNTLNATHLDGQAVRLRSLQQQLAAQRTGHRKAVADILTNASTADLYDALCSRLHPNHRDSVGSMIADLVERGRSEHDFTFDDETMEEEK